MGGSCETARDAAQQALCFFFKSRHHNQDSLLSKEMIHKCFTEIIADVHGTASKFRLHPSMHLFE
jgi:hypothetical protein